MSFQILQLNDQSVSIAIIDKNIELSYEDALIKKTMDDANEKTLWSQSGKLIFYNIEDSNNLINKKSVKIKIFEINDQTFTYRNMLMLPFKINAKCYVNISFYGEQKEEQITTFSATKSECINDGIPKYIKHIRKKD